MRRRIVSGVSVLVTLAVLTTAASAQSSTGLQRGLQDAERERTVTEAELSQRRAAEGDARSRLEAAEAEHARAQAELAAIEAALAEATAQREAALARAETLRAELAAAEEALAETEAELTEVQGRFDARIAGAYKRGSTRTETAFVGQMLSQETIADALSTAPFLTAVMDADRRVVDELRDVRVEVQAQRAEAAELRTTAEREAAAADRAAADAARQAAEQERAAASVAARRAELDAAHDAIVQDRRAVESHLASIEAESARLQGALQALAEQRAREAREREEAERRRQDEAAQQPGPAPGDGGEPAPAPPGDDGGQATPAPSPGGWQWPAACRRVTSGFGGRNSPGGVGSTNHRGVDIACTSQNGWRPTPIYASRGGVVAPVGCGGGYGVCLIIDHLDGHFTLYAHMSSVAVSQGQSVSGGQQIGMEGSTGNSTGPHLHFELWEGGTKVDPCPRIGC